jgi:hypothetical protein
VNSGIPGFSHLVGDNWHPNIPYGMVYLYPIYHAIWYIVTVIIERDGVRYRRTSVEVREDLHQKAKDEGWNMAALLNKALEDKVKGKKIG